MTDYQDIYYKSDDGLTLYARDYIESETQSRYPVLAMHGLTRNSADFEGPATYLKKSQRLVAVDQRGRGRSAYDKNWENYQPQRYVKDMWTLLDYLNIEAVVLLGTSMGGLMAMMMAAEKPERIKAIILNDIGPVVEAKGLTRIKDYVGKMPKVANWQEAVEQTINLNKDFYPHYQKQDWAEFAKRTYIEQDGIPTLAYDPKIGTPIDEQESTAVPPDLWPLFEASAHIPILTIRGALSDILSEKTLDEMTKRHPNCTALTVADTGHAPFLIEPEAKASLEAFLNKINRC